MNHFTGAASALGYLAAFFGIVSSVVAQDDIQGHDEYVYQIAFAREHDVMVTAAGDNRTLVWDAKAKRVRHVLEHEAAVYSAMPSPDGRFVATGDGDGNVALWNATSGELLRRVKKHADAVYAVAFSPDGKRLASAGGSTDGGDAICRLWKLPELEPLRELEGHERQVYGVTFSPDGGTLATSSSDRTIRLWNVESGEATTWRGHTSDVYRCAFSPDGKQLASTSQDATVRLWSVATGDVLFTHHGIPRNPFYAAAFTPDGAQLATVGDDRRLRVLRTRDLELVFEQELSKKALYAVAFHAPSKQWVSAGEDGEVRWTGVRQVTEQDR